MIALDFSKAEDQALSRIDYLEVDQPLARGEMRFDRALAGAYAAGLARHPEAEAMAAVKTRSMLTLEPLPMMRAFALAAGGLILEIGAYLGDRTLALASGVMVFSRVALFTVARGGVYPDHPHVSTSDNTIDWVSAVYRNNFSQKTISVEGFAHLSQTKCQVQQRATKEKFKLFLFDTCIFAFNCIERRLDSIAKDVLIVDRDSFRVRRPTETHAVKAPLVLRPMAQAVAAGAVEMFVHLPWSTWFGRAPPAVHDVMPDLIVQAVAVRDAPLAAKFGSQLPPIGAPRLLIPR